VYTGIKDLIYTVSYSTDNNIPTCHGLTTELTNTLTFLHTSFSCLINRRANCTMQLHGRTQLSETFTCSQKYFVKQLHGDEAFIKQTVSQLIKKFPAFHGTQSSL